MSAPPLSSSFFRGAIGRWFRRDCGRGLCKEEVPPFQSGFILFARFCHHIKVCHCLCKVRSACQGGRASRRHSVQQRLQGEDAAHLTADPSRDADDLAELFQENGACGIQRLLVRNAVTVACKRFLLQTGAEKRRQEERRRGGQLFSG